MHRDTLAGDGPDLIEDDGHHEKEIEAEGPEDNELGTLEMAAGDEVLFRSDELVVLEGGEDHGLVGGGNYVRSVINLFRHHVVLST